MYRLIALDIDGTLLNGEHQVPRENYEAIQEARAAGVKVVLATGRSWPEAVEVARDAGCDDLVVCEGGAAVADFARGAILESWKIPDQTGLEILEALSRWEVGLMLFAGEELVINSRCEEAFRNYPSATFRSKRVVCDDLTGFLKEHGLPLNKIFLLGRPDQFPALRALLGRWEDVYITSSGPDNLEILARGVDKGTGIAALARRLGIPMEEVMGIGDSDNDRGMLAAVGMPVVMGNAAPEIQALGRHITDTNENAGVAKAIRHFLRREEA